MAFVRAASAVVGRRQASALRSARDRIPKDADGRNTRLSASRRPVLFEHDPENACPGLDPGWNPVFRKDHAPLKAERDLEAAGIHRRRHMTGSGSASCASYWQNSGAAAPRERVRMFAPLPAARGEVEGAKRPTVRGPLRDSERSGSRNGGANSGREVKAQPRGPLIPTFSPHAGRRRPVAMKTSARVRACAPFTRAVKPLTMECVGERRA